MAAKFPRTISTMVNKSSNKARASRNPREALGFSLGILLVGALIQLFGALKGDALVFPGVDVILRAFGKLIVDPHTWVLVGTSLRHLVLSMLIATFVGLTIGLAEGLSGFIRALFRPLMNLLRSIPMIVLVVIISAAGLAFIVLYNLTNINITERLREIATIKVLGFFRKESASYVFRENIALTLFGTIFGLGLGVLLHRYVMKQIVVDMVCFRVQILPISFLYSSVLTFIFTLMVNAVMEIKIEKINMAESLKSVE